MMDASSKSIGNVCAMQAFVFSIHKLLAMLFLLAHSSLDVLHPVLIVIWYSLAASCFMYFKVFMESSSMYVKLCRAQFATLIFSLDDAPGIFPSVKPLYTSSVDY